MPDWYRPYLLLVALMVTSLASMGALALWATAFGGRRLARVAIVLLIPAPLLFRQAYDLYALFAMQTALIAVGVALTRGNALRGPRERTSVGANAPLSPLAPRFSLTTLLVLTAAIAVGLTAVIQLPKWENLAWRTVLLSAVGGATGTLAGAWLCSAKRRWLAAPAALIVCIALGTFVSSLDWFFEATLQIAGWPPRFLTPASFMGSPANYDDYDAWVFIPLAIALVTSILTFLWREANLRTSDGIASTRRRRRNGARGALVAFALIIAGLPLAALIALVRPAPLPKLVMPVPNGHHDFLRAAIVAAAGDFNVSDIDNASIDRVSPLAAGADAIDALIVSALDKPCYVPTNYGLPRATLSQEQVNDLYAVELALSAKARLAVLEGRLDDAVDVYLRAAEFGFAASRGAMVHEGALLRARSSFGTRGLYAIRTRLSDEQLAKCVERFYAISASDESMDEVLYRHRVWSERRHGWHGHLKFLLETIAVRDGDALGSDYWHRETFRHGYLWSHAITRLLTCEFALARYHRKFGKWPETLAALVPKYLPAVPIDPYSPTADELKYRTTEDSYLLYSIHRDGVDHHGRPTHPAEWDVKKFRDLRLDHAFSK
ncbi:hypothetical protein [Lacipirellula sp.]|uniref:hypothetical protein n=1 Tax=Lacipirellula sp. TaxID=2691419 RepID=UPI003D0DAC18